MERNEYKSPMKKLKKIFTTVLVLIVLLTVYYYRDTEIVKNITNQVQENIESLSPIREATVERVVDGDTLVVNLDNEKVKVRLIGVDCPESVHKDKSKNTRAGKLASMFTKDLLPKNTKVFLEFDKEPKDRYGRTLAYVWLEKPNLPPITQPELVLIATNQTELVRTKMLNGILVDKGHAKAKTYKPNVKYKTIFEEIEKGNSHE